MKVAIIGSTGFIGNVLVNEVLERGHEVTAISRNINKLAIHPGLNRINADVMNVENLSEVLSGHDVVISAYASFHSGLPLVEAKQLQVSGIQAIIDATKKAKIARLLVVGGAGSLKVSSGEDLVDTPDFPEQWKEMAKSTRDVLNVVKREKTLQWTFLSPSTLIKQGKRTGKFRLGGDDLLINDKGESEISLEDYAMAMIDEMERPKHVKQRFTVGY